MKNTSTLIFQNSLLFLASLFTIFSLSATAQTKQAAARITQAVDEANLVTIRGSVNPLARAGFDQGLVADSRPMNHMLLVLQRSPQQETALRNLIDSQQVKNSTNYHAWLTPQQFGQQFGVADADIQKVADWLSQKGFTEIKASNGSMFIEFSGTAGLVRSAFHTEIHNVMVNGQLHFANLSDPQIPAALAPVVARIHSLHDFRQKSAMHLSKSMQQLKAEGKLTKPGFGSGTGFFAVGPGDLATIYNIPATVAGSPAGQGQTIAIVARSNITISDITQFGSAFGIPSLANFSTSNIIVNGPDPGIVAGDDGEATLDVDMVGSTAPNANILLVVNGGTVTGSLAGLTNPTDGVDQSALYIVTNNLAPIMSQSFGFCEAGVDTAFNSTLWEQGAAQGISIFVSTGDTGSAGCDPDVFLNASSDGLQISGAASTPFNIAVGGTDFNDASNPTTYWNDTQALATAKSYIPEIPWNDSCAFTATATTLNSACSSIDPTGANTNPPTTLDLTAGSGGQSTCGVQNATTCTGYPKPSWQSAPGVPTDGVRDIPDVSLFASVNSPSGHFYVFCLADSGNQDPTQPCNLTGNPIVNGQFSYNFSGVGGTSASTPAWAGIMALVNQSELAAGRGGRQGNANYVLYKLATNQSTTPGTSACNSSSAIPNSACTFNDITLGNNSVACVGSFTIANGFGNLNNPDCSTQALNGLGVLVEPGAPFSANTPAWTATAGYDLATGLGTPNVSNLIANWGTVTTNFKAATPAITSPASGTVSITHGQNQAFTITVTGAGGTPTGDISLIAEPPGFGQVGAGSATLVNGTATITTNMLPGDDTTGAGTPYPVIAHYAGDGTFGPADSQPINVTVNRENSTTTATMFNEDIRTGFLTPTSSVQYGTNYIMIVNVVGATAGAICNNTSPTSITQIPEVPCPTGNITLTENGSPLNDFLRTGSTNTNISSVGNLGFVEDVLIQLFGGVNPIVAAYSGDNSYNPSSSTPPTSITVTPAPTQTTVGINGATTATVNTGQSVTLVAVVNTNYTQACGNTGSGPTTTCPGVSNGGGPTGTITFSACGTAASCTVPVVPTSFSTSSGVAVEAFATGTLTTSFATAGPQTIKATFTSGDANYSSCTANGTPASCTLSPLSLTVSGAVGAATQLAFVGQPSNVPVGLSISPGVQVAVEDANGNIVAGATNTVTISAIPGSAGLVGTTVTGTPVKGIVTFTNLSFIAAGTGYTLNASATGLTSTVSSPFNVILPANKLAFLVQPTSTNPGALIVPSVQVAVEDTNGRVVLGATNSITIAIGNNPSSGTLGGTATATPVNGVATFPNLTISAGGNGYTLTASSTSLTGATSAPFNVLTAATQLAFITEPSTTVAGSSIAPAVRVAIEDANGSIVAGATTPIVIAIGTNPGSGTLAGITSGNPANGVATFSNLNISTLGTGYTLTASAAGLTSATSTAFNVTAPTGPTFTVSSTPLILVSATGASAASTITVTPSGGFTGAVIVTAGTLPPGVTCPNSPLTITVTGVMPATGTLNCMVTQTSTTLTASIAREDRMLEAKTIPPTTGGKGWLTLSAGTGFAALFMLFLPGGRKKFRAALGLGLVCLLGITAGCNGASGGPVPPPLTPTVTKLTANTGSVASGTAFTFSVAVTGGTPTGSVQLFDGTTMIGAAANVSGGTAVPTAPALTVGTHAITAHYLGDSTTAASQSATPLNLTVTGTTTIAITTSPVASPAAPAINVTVQ
jgi:hypothetical protein